MAYSCLCSSLRVPSNFGMLRMEMPLLPAQKKVLLPYVQDALHW